MLPFLRSQAAKTVTGMLLAGSFVFYVFATPGERPVNVRPLRELPQTLGPWSMVGEHPIEAAVQNVLKADDSLMRTYAGPNAYAHVFIAFFKSQRAGVAPHSPKNCLPGSGWAPSKSDTIDIPIEGRADPIRVNRYIVSKGDDKSLVLYWYQSHQRVIASEYAAKAYLVMDSVRYRRSDTSLVRITVPIGESEEQAERNAIKFVRDAFGPVSNLLPA